MDDAKTPKRDMYITVTHPKTGDTVRRSFSAVGTVIAGTNVTVRCVCAGHDDLAGVSTDVWNHGHTELPGVYTLTGKRFVSTTLSGSDSVTFTVADDPCVTITTPDHRTSIKKGEFVRGTAATNVAIISWRFIKKGQSPSNFPYTDMYRGGDFPTGQWAVKVPDSLDLATYEFEVEGKQDEFNVTCQTRVVELAIRNP